MKLLFVSNLFPSKEEAVRGLDNANLLHYLERLGVEVRVVAIRPRRGIGLFPGSAPGDRAREIDRGFDPLYVAAPYVPRVGSRCNHHLMRRALRGPLRSVREGFRFDAILCSWLYPDGCAVARLAQEIETPCVLVCQGTDGHGYLRNPVRRKAIMEAAGRSARVITRSGRLRDLLAEAGADPAKVRAIYNGVDTDLFRLGDRLARRRELGYPEEANLLLYVGNFYDVKNPLLLVRAFARLCAREERDGAGEFHLTMIGAGYLREEIEKAARDLGCGARLRLAGELPVETVAGHMQAADLLCVPSRNEGVPNVVLEAFAAGLPVIARDVGGIHEVLTEAKLGALVDREDDDAFAAAILEAVKAKEAVDPREIQRHGAQFSWEASAGAYRDLLREVIDEAGA